jgi:hypothetical protein
VDGLRNYPDEPDGRRYADRYRQEEESHYDGYRVPDPRYEEPRSWGGEVPAPAPPAVAEGGEQYRTQPIDRDALHRQMQQPGPAPSAAAAGPARAPGHAAPETGPAGGAVYRSGRLRVAAVLAAAAVVAELILLRVLLVAEFGAHGTAGDALAGLFGLAGVPLTTMGLYALATGAASAGQPPGRLWLRVPLAYLPIGLLLLLTAGIAAG